MNIRRFAALAVMSATCALLGTAAGGAHADAVNTPLGNFEVGDSVPFTFTCPNPGNSFFLFLGNSKVDDLQSLDPSTGLTPGYEYDTSALEPGEYTAGIECNDAAGIYDFSFTLYAVGSLPPTGSSSDNILLIGALALMAGTGLLIARRRILA